VVSMVNVGTMASRNAKARRADDCKQSPRHGRAFGWNGRQGKKRGGLKPPRSIASFDSDGVWLRFLGFLGVGVLVAGQELR
jgi:hypothetical protein